jgi:uncharacterized protein YbjT (DUF2867 family)
MSSTYTKFAVAGAGNIGSVIVQRLSEIPGVEVTVLTRSSVKVPSGVKAVQVDYFDASTLRPALSGIQVLLSTLPTTASEIQVPLADAAKSAGVDLFVPAEYGIDTVRHTQGPTAAHGQFREYLKKIGLAGLSIATGAFTDALLPRDFFGFDWKNKRMIIVGEGVSKITMTTRDDVARFVAHILTSSPPSTLKGQVIRLSGDAQSMLSIKALYEETHPGVTISAIHITPEEKKKKLESLTSLPPKFKEMIPFLIWLLEGWDRGMGEIGEPLSNGMWEEWNPKSVRDIVATL